MSATPLCIAKQLFVTALAAVLVASATGAEWDLELPTGANPPAQRPEDIRQGNPGFLVRVDVDRATRSYRQGDTLSISVACEADAYLYVLYKQADDKVFQIFPNSSQAENKVKARQAVQIPATNDLFRWVVDAPFGKEIIKVIASREPLTDLSDPAMRAKFFNPVSVNNIKGIELELGKEPTSWAEDTCEIITYAANKAPEQASRRRFGLFIGLGEYAFLRQVIERPKPDGSREEVSLAYTGHRDARLLGGIMREVGQLTDMKLLTNDQAGRKQVEDAITKWLPAVSRPGDTVMIFFAGRAVPVPAPDGNSMAGAALACHNHMLAADVRTLLKKFQEGKITVGEAESLKAAARVIGNAKNDVQVEAALARGLGIPDDLFVHWLQGLAGRQVIVILDVPYAGAFVSKSAAAGGPPTGGMAYGLNRLQTLGQRDVVLFGACPADWAIVQRDPQALSLMSQCLLQCLNDASGAVSVEQACEDVTKRIEKQFEIINQRLQAASQQAIAPYKPVLIGGTAKAVMLKP